MSTIRIETDGASDLSRVHGWLMRHRGQIVELDDSRRLALGVPISGARAVIVAVALQDDDRTGPKLGGVLRAVANRTDREPVRLVFDVRSAGGLEPADAKGSPVRSSTGWRNGLPPTISWSRSPRSQPLPSRIVDRWQTAIHMTLE